MIKSRRMRLADHVSQIEKKNTYGFGGKTRKEDVTGNINAF
jgi:hypothetical protein